MAFFRLFSLKYSFLAMNYHIIYFQKHKIPYIQQNVWIRLWKTVQIMVGSTSMLKYKEVVKAA